MFCDGVGETAPDKGYVQRTDWTKRERGATCVANADGIRCRQPAPEASEEAEVTVEPSVP